MGRQVGAKQATKEKRDMILDMVDIGIRQVDIAKYYGMPKFAISNIVKAGRLVKGGETRGRNKKFSSRDIRSLLKLQMNNVLSLCTR